MQAGRIEKMKTLGIDLGTNSLGWAILDEKSVQKAGVLVFEEGVNREQSDSLETPAATRRAKRMARRLRFRRHMRRRLVLKILIENKMCPLTFDELKAWSQSGKFPRENPAFLEWLKSTEIQNPYGDRARAALGQVGPLVLGRAIYHLSQRRGFKSGRKDQAEAGEETNAAKAKELGQIKGDIARISAILEKSGLTLGQYFYNEIKAGRKVRKQHTGRVEHYEKEWAKIATVQKLDKKLSDKIARALFWQRPLREQSHLVGKCPLEPKYKRAQIGHPEFEKFRVLSFVNNIRMVDGETRKPLNNDQRTVAANCFVRKSPFEFKSIRLALEKQFKELKRGEYNFEDSLTLSPSIVTAGISELLPVGTDIQKAFDALVFFDDNEKLKVWAEKKLGLLPEAAAQFVKIRVPEGRAGYSLHAIRKINRFLCQGVELSEAVLLAKLPDVIPGFVEKEQEFIAKVHEHAELYRENKKTAYHDSRFENRIGVLSLEKRLRSWLEESHGIGREVFDKLYFRDPKADSSYADVRPGGEILPPVNLGMIRNPLVQRSMTMLRKLVNALRKKGSIDDDTRIHIELARDVNSRNDRMAIQEWQKRNEKNRADARAKLLEHGLTNPADDLILKMVLAEEQGWVCPYTGNSISLSGGGSLFSGFDIEHTLPRSRSGDDSQANLTLCDIHFNRNVKKDRMPSELSNHDEIVTRLRPWVEKIEELKKLKQKQAKIAKSIPKDNPEARSRARQKMLVTKMELKYWEDKYYRFTKKPDDVTPSFISRQLVDTGVMTRHAVALLRTVYPDVYPVNGQAVAFARKLWKVQGEDEKKDRSDHTHHAKDAMVIAALSRDRFLKICTELKADDEKKNPKFTVAPPFAGFSQVVHDVTSAILVKHVTRHNELKQTRRRFVRLSSPKNTKDGTITCAPARGSTIRGQLHNETFYGKIVKPGEKEPVCVIRKELNSANFAQASALEKIIDPAVRRAVQEEITRRGGDFKKALDAAVEEGTFKLPGERGALIKKVRIEATVANPKGLRLHDAVQPKHAYKAAVWVQAAGGSNFRLAVYERPVKGEDGRETLFIAENLLDHAQGKITQPTKAKLIGYILPGAMAIACQNNGEWQSPGFASMVRLYDVLKFTEANNTITLRFHREARRMKDLSADLIAIGKKGAGQSSIDFEQPHELLLLNFKKAWSSFLFEGIHFTMGLDGEITYKK
jgi:CRISPR-associated endonuclease Csn1